ncbi:MAG: hypothetical protein AAFR54_21550, partial [Planctomycetota bacterium]
VGGRRATAYSSLDDALSVASPGNHVWVARGVYRPSVRRDPADPRSASFAPGRGVRLFGGFDGTETTLSDRAGLFDETVLEGERGAPGFRRDNVRNVVRLEGNGAIHVVDGFTIQGGYADGSGLGRGGGAISSQLGTKTIRNCRMTGNYGRIGGALLTQISIVQLSGCTFEANGAAERGGAAWITGQFTGMNCVFDRNVARGTGGALHITQGVTDTAGVAYPRFQNTVFKDNLATWGGAAFVADPPGGVAPGRAAFSGCTFVGNGAFVRGAAIGTPLEFSPNIEVQLVNSIVWGNRAVDGTMLSGDPMHYQVVARSIVQSGWPGATVLDVDPLFVDLAARDLELSAGSPAIDAGDTELILRDELDLDGDDDFIEPTPFDAAGRARRIDDPLTADTGAGTLPTVDLGAFEYDG